MLNKCSFSSSVTELIILTNHHLPGVNKAQKLMAYMTWHCFSKEMYDEEGYDIYFPDFIHQRAPYFKREIIHKNPSALRALMWMINISLWLLSPIFTLWVPRGREKKDSHLISPSHSFCSSIICFYFVTCCHYLLKGLVSALSSVATSLSRPLHTDPFLSLLVSEKFVRILQENCRSLQQ